MTARTLFLVFLSTLLLAAKSETTFKNVTIFFARTHPIANITSSNNLKDHLPKENLIVVNVAGKIPILYKDSVSDINTVFFLEFLDNELKEIQPGAFNNFHNVQKLRINHNDLTTIEEGVFDHLEIPELDLSYNQISGIEKGALKNMPQLQTLYLGRNQLKTLKDGVFDGLEKLHKLDLSDNFISTLPEGFFRNMPNLKLVFLNGNRIHTLRKEFFQNSSIRYLDLSLNNITTLSDDFFGHLPNLRRINLSFNEIKTIPKGVFNGQNLDRIQITNNKISSIDPEAFDKMPNLADINLSSNKIKRYDSRWFHETPKISRLFLSNNQIEELPDEAFKNIYNEKEQWIRLDGNKIKNVTPQTFKGFKRIKYLHLAHNEIDNWNSTFLEDAEFIRFLNLMDNKISCPVGSFDRIFQANFTYLDHNPLTHECVQHIQDWSKQNPDRIACTEFCALYYAMFVMQKNKSYN